MTNDYRAVLEDLKRELGSAREELEGLTLRLTGSDLHKARRGGWTVARVLQHVIESERHYARLVSRLRRVPPPEFTSDATLIGSGGQAFSELRSARAALLGAIEGIEEDSFYRLEQVGHEEYSVASLLENVANHDREHAGQVSAIVAGES